MVIFSCRNLTLKIENVVLWKSGKQNQILKTRTNVNGHLLKLLFLFELAYFDVASIAEKCCHVTKFKNWPL